MIIRHPDRFASEFHLLFSFMFYSFRGLNSDLFLILLVLYVRILICFETFF